MERYLESDKIANNFNSARPRLFGDEIWKFLRALRKLEYYSNVNCFFGRYLRIYWHIKYHFWSLILDYSIPINVIDEGLRLFHRGTIIVSRFAKIGKFASIHACVNIGQNKFRDETPIIGDYCMISPGAKLFGKITIGSNVTIGTNSVVNKSFTENNITIAGIPAKIIRTKQVVI
ncbi:MAG: hypothetical protein K2H85_03260 [Allobaculum sp.]|nr:hypothetical protein [Allobaculum sp.]